MARRSETMHVSGIEQLETDLAKRAEVRIRNGREPLPAARVRVVVQYYYWLPPP
jgi:hypothetical protein